MYHSAIIDEKIEVHKLSESATDHLPVITNFTSNACISDVFKLWNCAPKELKECSSYNQLKKTHKDICENPPSLNIGLSFICSFIHSLVRLHLN